MAEHSTSTSRDEVTSGVQRRTAVRGLLLLEGTVRLVLWSLSAAVGACLVVASGAWSLAGFGLTPVAILGLTVALAMWVLAFNVVYVLALVALRALIPTPREGRYGTYTGGGMPRDVLYTVLIAVLTKARYLAPFPGFLVGNLSALPPLSRLVERTLGPRSGSCWFLEPQLLDPHLVTIGRNVIFGHHAIISGHTQTRDDVILKRTVIGDDVVIGGHAILFSGVVVGDGAMIGAGAVVPPNTHIGPNEFWAGVPARKVRDLPPRNAWPA